MVARSRKNRSCGSAVANPRPCGNPVQTVRAGWCYHRRMNQYHALSFVLEHRHAIVPRAAQSQLCAFVALGAAATGASPVLARGIPLRLRRMPARVRHHASKVRNTVPKSAMTPRAGLYEQLQARHARLDRSITRASNDPGADWVEVMEMKRLRLALRDRMATLPGTPSTAT